MEYPVKYDTPIKSGLLTMHIQTVNVNDKNIFL